MLEIKNQLPEKPMPPHLLRPEMIDELPHINADQSPSKKENNILYHSYHHYYSTGAYKLRYPHVNLHTLSFINHYISHKKPTLHLLDYGCGNGRYLLQLLNHSNIQFLAYDISATPLKMLYEKLIHLKESHRVQLFNDIEKLEERHKKNRHFFDIVLLLFGVLSHIKTRTDRHQLLCYLRKKIAPTHGKLILSVPNQQRRFLFLQKQQKSHNIIYSRMIDNNKITFNYHLYTIKSIKNELNLADLDIIDMHAESVLPESWITRIPLLGWIDHQICKVIPAQWGYGILICCQAK